MQLALLMAHGRLDRVAHAQTVRVLFVCDRYRHIARQHVRTSRGHNVQKALLIYNSMYHGTVVL